MTVENGTEAAAVIIVTGAAGGIGRDLARALAGRGHALLLADIDAAAVDVLAAELAGTGARVAATRVDIISADSARDMVGTCVSKFGQVDALIHCAGIDAPRGRLWELEDAEWSRIIDADLSGAWWCTKAVLAPMLARKSGRIVLIGSVAARAASPDMSVAYNAAKAGITGLALALSAQVEHAGIRLNVIAPGPTGTGNAMTPDERVTYQQQFPLGEGGTRPVVEACLYLLGPGGDWLSGSVLNVSGGRLRG